MIATLKWKNGKRSRWENKQSSRLKDSEKKAILGR